MTARFKKFNDVELAALLKALQRHHNEMKSVWDAAPLWGSVWDAAPLWGSPLRTSMDCVCALIIEAMDERDRRKARGQ